jgi:NADPH:quinone reductase-like Zn-dependent oxidoreductase
MKAVRIHRFGGPAALVIDELPIPAPGPGELLVRVAAAGVGPWDALIREGKSKVSPPPPLTLGSDLSGEVEAVGPGVAEFKVGDQVYGVTNPQFCGANAEYAVASAAMIARKPERLSHIEAASAPVVAVTAWQMLFDYAKVTTGQRILILGAAGNVGAYVVQSKAWAVEFFAQLLPCAACKQGLSSRAKMLQGKSSIETLAVMPLVVCATPSTAHRALCSRSR